MIVTKLSKKWYVCTSSWNTWRFAFWLKCSFLYNLKDFPRSQNYSVYTWFVYKMGWKTTLLNSFIRCRNSLNSWRSESKLDWIVLRRFASIKDSRSLQDFWYTVNTPWYYETHVSFQDSIGSMIFKGFYIIMCEICGFFRLFFLVCKSGSCSNITYIHSPLLLCLVVLTP